MHLFLGTAVVLFALLTGSRLYHHFFPTPPPAPEAPKEVTITFPEGFTLAQMGERVRAAIPTITATDWEAAVGVQSPLATEAFVVAAQKPASVDLEGYLFPDTYRFFADATADDVAQKMVDTMDAQFTPDMRAELEKHGRTIHEALTVASIVEREVMDDADRATVADIFWRRLDAGMALQADSTVNYVTGGTSPSVSDDDRRVDSPYNTYLYPGLPPGPISNPGLASLTATVFPEANGYWYFLTDADGAVHYARTNDEQNANKARYLR